MLELKRKIALLETEFKNTSPFKIRKRKELKTELKTLNKLKKFFNMC